MIADDLQPVQLFTSEFIQHFPLLSVFKCIIHFLLPFDLVLFLFIIYYEYFIFFQPVLIWVYFILCDVAWLLCTVDIKAKKVLMCVRAVVFMYGRYRKNKIKL